MRELLRSLSFRMRLNIHYGACIFGSIITMLGCYISQDHQLHPLAWMGIGITAAGLVWRILFVKCPYCGDGQYQSRADLKQCPNCGNKLK